MRRFLVVVVAAVLSTAALCGPGPKPTPTPEPTVEPTAPPTPEPPEPTAPPPPSACTLPLDGQPVAKAYKLYPAVMDFTPLIYNPERCKAVGFGDRQQCPTAPDEHPQRYICEVTLIGGPGPLWELVRDEGDLRWEYEDEQPIWKARVLGTGKGRIRACYPNGKACSPWIEIDKK